MDGDRRQAALRHRRRGRAALLLTSLVGSALLWATGSSRADDPAEPRACRSVHLGYPGRAATAFSNEVNVTTSAAGSYFMVCGWDQGYFGLQELANGQKLLLFSVWDSELDDPNAVPEDRRVRLIAKDPAVRVQRFGGEGSGVQAFFDYPWKTGVSYRLLVTARPAGQRTEYTGYLFLAETRSWKRLVTFSALTGGKPLRGYYSFIEDFLRDGRSARQPREARFGGGWLLEQPGRWSPIQSARFTADDTPSSNIDAGRSGDGFYLATGGATVNRGARLNSTILFVPRSRPKLPIPLAVLFLRHSIR